MENNNIFNFEKLEVWQKAMDLTVEIYKITNDFPKSEQFSLTDQLRRAISSVTANIAEGTGRLSHKDQAHFTTNHSFCQFNGNDESFITCRKISIYPCFNRR